jgi:hypothetical protein
MAEAEGSFPNASSNDPAALDLSVGATRGTKRRFASIDSSAARCISRLTFL